MNKFSQFILLFILFGISNIYSQPGNLDTSFDPGTGANGTINTIALQADGKIIIGGDFTNYNGFARNRIARINTDGSLDTSFDIGVGFDMGYSGVQSLVVDSDGKIIVVGGFTKYNTIPRKHIVRINTDGTIDNTFSIGTGADNPILSVATQPDGKIIIGGGFTKFNTTNIANRILRLNSDGSFDTSFTTGTGVNDLVNTITVQTDGKIIIGGGFNTYNGVDVNKLARLNVDGTIDSGFSTITATNNAVWCARIQADNKIIISGLFTLVNSIEKKYLARLNVDGSLDNDFDIGIGANNLVRTLALQYNDKILFGGTYQTYNSISANRISRLMPSGLKDTNFDTGTGANNAVNSIMIQPDGHFIMVGNFTTYNGVTRNRIARVFGDPTPPLSTPDFKNNIVNVYPNPSNGILFFSTANDIQMDSAKIFDSTGKLIFSASKIIDNKIDISNLSNGIYFISLQNDEKGIYTQKFIKN